MLEQKCLHEPVENINMFTLSVRGPSLYVRIWRQIPTYKDDLAL